MFSKSIKYFVCPREEITKPNSPKNLIFFHILEFFQNALLNIYKSVSVGYVHCWGAPMINDDNIWRSLGAAEAKLIVGSTWKGRTSGAFFINGNVEIVT